MVKRFIFIVVGFLLVGCTQGTMETEGNTDSPFLVTQTPSGLFLIKMEEEEVFIHDVSREAMLIQEGNCLRMLNKNLPESGLAIWENQVEIRETDGMIQIENVGPAGQIRIGDEVNFGATRIVGVSGDEFLEWQTPIPVECRKEPYYIIRGVRFSGE